MLDFLTNEILNLYWQGISFKDALKKIKEQYKEFLDRGDINE